MIDAMADKYESFAELAREENAGKAFLVRFRERRDTVVVIAPHGGGIEPGTSEIAEAIAGDDFSSYTFEGMKQSGNSDLHITSTRFDEPECLALVAASPMVLSIHGEESAKEIVFLGGKDAAIRERLRVSLTAKGFDVQVHPNLELQGSDPSNICNRGRSGGVQLELSNGLRATFFQSLGRQGRQTKTERFHLFIAAVREALLPD